MGSMNPRQCKHKNLALYAEPDDRVRCQHCHLTIRRSELKSRYCPECYEASGTKRYDFDSVAETTEPKTQYVCEDCGILIPVEM